MEVEAFVVIARHVGKVAGLAGVTLACLVAAELRRWRMLQTQVAGQITDCQLLEDSLNMVVLRTLWRALRAAIQCRESKRKADNVQLTAVRGSLNQCDAAR